MKQEIIDFDSALKKLKISEYKKAIWDSNSHGELMHCYDYISLANILKEEHTEAFRRWFIEIVENAKKVCDRPESIYQHIFRLFQQMIQDSAKNIKEKYY